MCLFLFYLLLLQYTILCQNNLSFKHPLFFNLHRLIAICYIYFRSVQIKCCLYITLCIVLFSFYRTFQCNYILCTVAPVQNQIVVVIFFAVQFAKFEVVITIKPLHMKQSHKNRPIVAGRYLFFPVTPPAGIFFPAISGGNGLICHITA